MKKMMKNLIAVIFMTAGMFLLTGTMPVYAATTAAGFSNVSVSSGKTYYIVSKGNANLVLDAAGGGTKNGTRIWLYSYNGTGAQQFRFQKNSDGTYTLINPRSNKALDIKGGSKGNGGILQLYTSNGTNAQKWTIKSNSDGTVTFINKGSGKALDVPGASFKTKKYLQQYTANNTNAQKFYLVDASTANGYIDASQVYTLLNQFRRENGLSALQRNTALENAAKVRAKECVVYIDDNHTRPDGSACETAMPAGYVWYGENEAEGQEDAVEVMKDWKESPDHREKMLFSEFRYVGVAAYRHNGVIYWVQDFLG